MNDERTAAAPAMFRRGDRVPSVTLSRWSSDEPFDLRPSRGPRVFIVLHDFDCGDCLRYVEAIASVREAVESWGGDVVVVSPRAAGTGEDPLSGIRLPVLSDPEQILSDGRPAVIVADRWGEVYHGNASEAAHDPVSPKEVVEWVKFVSIQCPECEGPEGEWRTL
jgi:hypothetical protein